MVFGCREAFLLEARLLPLHTPAEHQKSKHVFQKGFFLLGHHVAHGRQARAQQTDKQAGRKTRWGKRRQVRTQEDEQPGKQANRPPSSKQASNQAGQVLKKKHRQQQQQQQQEGQEEEEEEEEKE